MCRGSYLEFMMSTFARARTLSIQEQQIKSDIKDMCFPPQKKNHKTRCSVSGLFAVMALIGKVTQMRQLHGKPSLVLAKHPSLTLSIPRPLSLSFNPHWEGEGETREAEEDEEQEEEGSDRTGQRLRWHPWESADPFSGNY